MKSVYLKIAAFNLLAANAYLHEVVAKFFQQITPLLFNIILWSIVVESDPDSEISLSDLTGYYVMSAGLGVLLMLRYGRFGGRLRDVIKGGTLNQYLVKPMNEIMAIYSEVVGKFYGMYIIASLFILLGLFFQKDAISSWSIVFFAWGLLNAFFINFAWNILESGIAGLLTTEATGIRSTINHFTAFLSGFTVPLFFFPEEVFNVLQYTPFPHMLYFIIDAINVSEPTKQTFVLYGIGTFWAIILNLAVISLWNLLLKRYEGVGI